MQSIWTGLETAKVTDRGTFFGIGEFDLSIKRLLVKASEKTREQLFIAEFEILGSSCEENPPGTDGTWIVKLANQNAPGNIKGMILSVLGLDHMKDQARIATEIGPLMAPMMDRATGPANALMGRLVHLSTKKGRVNVGKHNEGDFTYHNFSPFNYAGVGQPAPDAGEIIRAVMSAPAPQHMPPQYATPYPVAMAAPVPGYPPAPPPAPYAPHYPVAAPIPPPPPPAPRAVQLSPDGLYKLVNNQWVPNT
jgi:hypothetical protein